MNRENCSRAAPPPSIAAAFRVQAKRRHDEGRPLQGIATRVGGKVNEPRPQPGLIRWLVSLDVGSAPRARELRAGVVELAVDLVLEEHDRRDHGERDQGDEEDVLHHRSTTLVLGELRFQPRAQHEEIHGSAALSEALRVGLLPSGPARWSPRDQASACAAVALDPKFRCA